MLGVVLVMVVQVVHHPTIMAAYCEGKKWTVTGDGELRSKFIGPSIQLKPVGVMHLRFHDGDEFTWHKVGILLCLPGHYLGGGGEAQGRPHTSFPHLQQR